MLLQSACGPAPNTEEVKSRSQAARKFESLELSNTVVAEVATISSALLMQTHHRAEPSSWN